ncbi:MAG: DUF1272 domain-containing protein [Flavobacteriaceae bacterium]|nr:DUF1272 domain-containing protein [Flavobacteriaceae bacterium]
MKTHCENCQKALVANGEPTYHCSYNCTFCKTCSETLFNFICPNCSGTLQLRI